ncbi:MAG TPA: mechanosensitive ion channel domain-containing protein, partial [Spirochaetota bacterium]|nr:mechanosensitive ion channel domain-containing protein [Spirochaetota bacterium]
MATILQSILTFFTENRHIILYLSIVILIFIWLLHFLIKQLTILKRKRKKLLKNKEQINAVPADSPPRNPTQTAKKVGMQSIESQFTISKKIIIPALITIFLLLLFIPMLDKIPATIISLVIGIITVIMSMAIRPFVENILSGIALSYSKAVNLGDTVLIDNNYGTIEDIKPICTTVKLWDWRRLIIPNSQMINRQFINYSLFDRYIWAYVEFEIAYNEDIKKIETIAKECARASAYFKNY